MSDMNDVRQKQREARRKKEIRNKMIFLVLCLMLIINLGLLVYNIITIGTVQDEKAEARAMMAEAQKMMEEMQASELSGPVVAEIQATSEADTEEKTEEASSEELKEENNETAEASESPETTASETEETKPQETLASETEETEPETTLSALEQDPRYAIVQNYDNIGIIYNVNNFLNIRKKANINSVSIGKAMKNSVVEVLEKTDNGWYKIKSGENTGYVSGEFVATGEEGIVLAMEKCKNNAFALKDAVPVYKSANTDSSVVFECYPQNGYNVIDVIGDWVKVQITDGLSGYMKKDQVDVRYTLADPIFFTADSKVSNLRLNIINYAFEWYGGDYVWGGETLGQGVDCSGYTLRVYEHYNVLIPRLSVEQSEWGEPVKNIKKALPGDLLFFHGYHDGNVTEGVGHVAIYIGDGKMIHAASEARGIVVDNYDYLGEPLCIRRVINDD